MKNKFAMFLIILLLFVTGSETFAYANTSETMKVYYIIDDNGYFIEPVFLIKQDGVDYSHYIETEPPYGMKKPRWDGVQWVEGYTEASIVQDIPETTDNKKKHP